MYALVEIKGKHYRVEEGSRINVDRISPTANELSIESVLLVSNGGNIKIGTPYVDGVSVKAVVERESRGKKVTIYKYKRRKNYRRKKGHRQWFTTLHIQNIEGVG